MSIKHLFKLLRKDEKDLLVEIFKKGEMSSKLVEIKIKKKVF